MPAKKTIQYRWQTKNEPEKNVNDQRMKELETAANILFIVVRGAQM